MFFPSLPNGVSSIDPARPHFIGRLILYSVLPFTIILAVVSVLATLLTGAVLGAYGGEQFGRGILSSILVLREMITRPDTEPLVRNGALALIGGTFVLVSLLMYVGRFFLSRSLWCLFAVSLLASLPLILSLESVAMTQLMNVLSHEQIKNSLRIENFSEEILYLPEIEGPLGVSIQFDIEFANDTRRSFDPVHLWKGSASVDLSEPNHEPDSFRPVDTTKPWYGPRRRFPDNQAHLMANPLELATNAEQSPVKSSDRKQHLVYSLIPAGVGQIWRSAAQDKLCLDAAMLALPMGQEDVIGASWSIFEIDNRRMIDLSSTLSKKLQEGSALRSDPSLWQQMYQTYSRENLERSGWQGCAAPSTDQNLQCYCREKTASLRRLVTFR